MRKVLAFVLLSAFVFFMGAPSALAHGGNSGSGNRDDFRHFQKFDRDHMRFRKDFDDRFIRREFDRNLRVDNVRNNATVKIVNNVKNVRGDVEINNFVELMQFNDFNRMFRH